MKKYYPYALCLSMLLAGTASAWTLKNTSSMGFAGVNGLNVSVPAGGTSTAITTPSSLTPSTVYGYLGVKNYSCKFEAASSAISSSQQIPIQTAALVGTSKRASCSVAQPRLCCYQVVSTGGGV